MPGTSDQPPSEVAADPARLAKWAQDRAQQQASLAAVSADWDVFEVSGCDHKDILVCNHPTGRKGGSVMNKVSCNWAPAP